MSPTDAIIDGITFFRSMLIAEISPYVTVLSFVDMEGVEFRSLHEYDASAILEHHSQPLCKPVISITET